MIPNPLPSDLRKDGMNEDKPPLRQFVFLPRGNRAPIDETGVEKKEGISRDCRASKVAKEKTGSCDAHRIHPVGHRTLCMMEMSVCLATPGRGSAKFDEDFPLVPCSTPQFPIPGPRYRYFAPQTAPPRPTLDAPLGAPKVFGGRTPLGTFFSGPSQRPKQATVPCCSKTPEAELFVAVADLLDFSKGFSRNPNIHHAPAALFPLFLEFGVICIPDCCVSRPETSRAAPFLIVLYLSFQGKSHPRLQSRQFRPRAFAGDCRDPAITRASLTEE